MRIDVCDEINAARDCGVVRCGMIESKLMTLVELAPRFGLIFASDTYREISKAQAEAVAETLAQVLASRFLSCFDEENPQYYTNGDYYSDGSSHGWNSATIATFDTGILIIGKSCAGCLWVEDED